MDIMIIKIFRELDRWAVKANREAAKNGWPAIGPFYIKVLGQTALLEAKVGLNLTATIDVDVFANYQHSVKNEFERLLNEHGKSLDQDSDKIWMPKETEYEQVFTGQFLTGFIAKSEYVLISKALKAPKKNHAIMVEYLAKGPSKLFMMLADKYNADLEDFIR
jgi:hypothetical protein